MQKQSVAVLGLGLIGSIWARHYQSEGILAATWSRSKKTGLPFDQTSLEDCASKASILHICVYDADSVHSVLQQLLPHLNNRHTVIQSSTIDGSSATEFAELVATTGARYLEAPFTGSKPAAEERKTVFFLGGDKEVIQTVEPALKTISAKRFQLGTPNQACAVKLAMNLQIAGISQALCESITMSRAAGIDDEQFFEVMKANVSWSGVSTLKEPKLRNNDFTPQFSVKNLHKDMRLARQQNRESLRPLLDCMITCLARTEEAGHAEEDFMALIQMLER
ncbi:MAG: NAD(P)-dependent oxidoreductase [Coraliomargarita sp.]